MASENIRTSLGDLQRQCDLLRKEYEYEKNSYCRQTQQSGIYEQIRRGTSWFPVSVNRSYYNSLNQLVVEIEKEETDEQENNFEYGRPVCFFTPEINGQLRYFNFAATVSYTQDSKMIVVLPGTQALSEINRVNILGIQLYFDNTSYRTMFAALAEVMGAKEGRTAVLREVLLGSLNAEKRAFYPVRFPWLNDSQQVAVNNVLQAKDVAVVHGPPGTGKTTTLVEAVYETLRKENQVLVCAQSNTAVDWIAEKLVDRGINVLRIGNPARINDKMLSFTYERRFEAHPDYPQLWQMRKTMREILAGYRKNGNSGREAIGDRLRKLRERAAELEIHIDGQLFGEARVVACTLVGSAAKVLSHKRFSSLFIDEAAQALEAACWIPIIRSDRVILAGDPYQLPPTIKCVEAAREGLNKTLIQKIYMYKPEVVSMLKIQYRMHDDIMMFPSRWFYNNELKSAPEVKNRGVLEFDTPLVWIDTAAGGFNEACLAGDTGRINTREAELLVEQLKFYIERIGKERVLDEGIDFGLISPYRAQVLHIRRLIRQDVFFKSLRRLITVHTVDGFQGQERDVIFISLVRANEDGNIGFLNDLRRMNVAITRAKMKLVILGDSLTLTRHAFYKAFYEYTKNKGIVIECEQAALI